VKCPSSSPPLTMKFYRWTSNGVGSSSNVVNLISYTDPLVQTFTSSFTKVSIPMSLFPNAAWPTLSGVETIYFNSDSQNRRCYIDNIAVLKGDSPTTSPTRLPTSNAPTLFPSVAPTREAAIAPSSILVSAFGFDPVFDGETGSFIPSRLDYASLVSGTGVLGSTGLKLNPDPWHSPAILLPASLYRQDVSRYNYFELFIRCINPNTPVSMSFGRWTATGKNATSVSVPLGFYALPLDTPPQGTIGVSWTKVQVPVSAFISPSWNLKGAETIYFNSDAASRSCTVDNLVAVTDKVPSVKPSPAPTAIPSASPSTPRPTRETIHVTNTVLEEKLGVQPIFDGEANSFGSIRIEYAAAVSGTGISGSVGLELRPDAWHSPALLLSDPVYRSDVSLYNEVLLLARCDKEDTPLSMHWGRWCHLDHQVQPVNLCSWGIMQSQ
jgi:hypothetical protein